MKKLALILFLISLVTASKALSAPAFGVKAGLNLAGIAVSPVTQGAAYSRRTGMVFGGNVEAALNSKSTTTLRGEFMYVSKGTKLLYQHQQVGQVSESWSTDELVLTPLLVMRFPTGGMTPFIQGGPELGLNMSKSYKLSYQGGGETGPLTDWGSTNFGINIGAGVAIPSGKGEFIVDMRYNLGMSNMAIATAGSTMKTNGIMICAGYNFSQPKK